MKRSEFHIMARSNWTAAINSLVPTGDVSVAWTKFNEIYDALSPFMGRDANHALLPTGGGLDFTSVQISPERGCLDFHIGGRKFVTVRPLRLHLERIAADPAESFLLLKLQHLEPSGAYDEDVNLRIAARREEPVVDLGEAHYVGIDGRDEGIYFDDAGEEHALPGNYRVITRFLGGSIMLVTKGSIWNGLSITYDALHDSMSSEEIRLFIQRLIYRRGAPSFATPR